MENVRKFFKNFQKIAAVLNVTKYLPIGLNKHLMTEEPE